jgi:hypothetical protein
MAELEKVLNAQGIPFSCGKNHVWYGFMTIILQRVILTDPTIYRCFAHIINVAVQHVLSALKKALTGDAVAHVCSMVHAVQASSDHCIAFLDTV